MQGLGLHPPLGLLAIGAWVVVVTWLSMITPEAERQK